MLLGRSQKTAKEQTHLPTLVENHRRTHWFSALLLTRFIRLCLQLHLQIRQLALVELRKRLIAKRSKQWIGQPQNVRIAIKGRMLEVIGTESSYVLYRYAESGHRLS